MAKQQDIDILKKACEDGQSIPIERLVSRSDWGPIKFEGARPALETAFFLFSNFSTLPVDIVPDGEFAGIASVARSVANQLKAIDAFDIQRVENPKGQADSQVQTLKAEVEQFIRVSSPYLPLLAYRRGNIQAQLAKLEETLAKASELYDKGKTSIDDKARQIDDALNAARTAAAKAGAAVFTQDFLNEAEKIEDSATTWLTVAGGCGVGALVLALISFFLFQPAPNATVTYVVQHTVTKLVVVGGLITAAIWCGSMYRALRHQAAINKHRGNALKTFQAFVEAAGDRQEIKDAVLLETTRSIFAVAPTGFLNATETNVDSGPKIADTLKAFGKGG